MDLFSSSKNSVDWRMLQQSLNSRNKKNIPHLLLCGLSAILLAACDPGLSGTSTLFNDSSKTLTIRYVHWEAGKTDTLTQAINP